MANIVSEVLDDGTIRVIDIDIAQEAAKEAVAKLEQKGKEQLNFDFTSSMFSIFVEAIHVLTAAGWTTEELIYEVIDHSEADDVDKFINENEDYDDDDDE